MEGVIEGPSESVPEGSAESPEEKIVAAPADKEDEAEAGGEHNWYIVQTFSGHEDRVKASIERNLSAAGLKGKIFQVLVPEEEVVEIKDAKRIEKKKKMYPGYVFVDMMLDDDTWYTIRQTPGVAKFIGSKTRPIPVTDREMQRVLKQMGMKETRLPEEFLRGEAVRVISGPFRGYTGSVEEINVAKNKLKVLINIFGRDTPVEIEFDQAEKIL